MMAEEANLLLAGKVHIERNINYLALIAMMK